MKWSIYNRLLESMERTDLVIRDFVVGTEWCMVLAEDGTAGLAKVRTEKWQRFPFQVDFQPGMPLKEAARGILSWNPYEAALGLAAVNAYFNREDFLSGKESAYPGGRRSRGVFGQFCESHTKGKQTLMLEPYYDREELANAPGIIHILRLDTTYRDYRFDAWEELLPQADSLVISGCSLADKTAGIVASAAADAGKDIFLWGPDAPLAPALIQWGVREITGFLADDPEKCMWTVKRAGTRDEILRLGHFVTEQKHS